MRGLAALLVAAAAPATAAVSEHEFSLMGVKGTRVVAQTFITGLPPVAVDAYPGSFTIDAEVSGPFDWGELWWEILDPDQGPVLWGNEYFTSIDLVHPLFAEEAQQAAFTSLGARFFLYEAASRLRRAPGGGYLHEVRYELGVNRSVCFDIAEEDRESVEFETCAVWFDPQKLDIFLIVNAPGITGPITYSTQFFSGPGAPYPEPATWALFVAGFGLMGSALRRRLRPA
jgi:hypothetical protein